MTIADDKPLSLVHVLSNRIGRAFHGEIETKFGITISEWRVLMTLTSEKGVSAAEITNRWAMEKMMGNRAIQRLVDNGCITRERDPNDRRRYRLALTPRGRTLYDKIAPTANKRYNELMSAIDSDETDALVRALQKIIQRAEQLN
ncbi:MAG: MarR family transcriptional regulator [Rhodospirillaceae bacterium TMED63]|nr:MarR family transcriptional regulator [Rhodospirillaceae bacterium]RPG02570.1 MAG: MarR family transcriptional regulator [Rhodospirillaceae bacterium TMED63]|tara:strand:- start:63 stop:497 length:435 start_codon:yes stop_codon:yes gene_type:complete